MKTDKLLLITAAILLIHATACEAMLGAAKNSITNCYAAATKLYSNFPSYKELIFSWRPSAKLVTKYTEGRFNERVKMELEKAKNGGKKQPFLDAFGVYIGPDGLVNTKKPINEYNSWLKTKNIFPKIFVMNGGIESMAYVYTTNDNTTYTHELRVGRKTEAGRLPFLIEHEITHALQGLNMFSKPVSKKETNFSLLKDTWTENPSGAVLAYIKAQQSTLEEHGYSNEKVICEANADELAVKRSPNPALFYHYLTHNPDAFSIETNRAIPIIRFFDYCYKHDELVDLVKKHCDVYYANGQHQEDFEVVKAFEKKQQRSLGTITKNLKKIFQKRPTTIKD